MTESQAKKIGSRKALISVGLGIIIAQLIMMNLYSDKGFLKDFFWFTTINYKFNLLIGILIFILSGHFFGKIAGKAILIKKRNFIIIGIACGMLILITTAFLSGWIGFFQEGIHNLGTNDNPFYDYIYKPFYWILLYGFIPVSIIGLLFGIQVNRYKEKI
jgi:hypothetical protein